ncbi:FecR domain-containing protein [uncultured Proteiniphilum sp.]|uniref:FecR family protein n=1 Tax=uncultured Proteiniphilum sp. TaxID=497637 RepID=UPI002633034B|nr:FecR domain-containing protein [uncultured Proteiniphilum sp.]
MNEKLSKYFLSELGQAETSELFHQLKTDESLQTQFIRLQNIYALSLVSPLSTNETEGRRGFQKFVLRLQTKKQRTIIRLAFQYAAVAVILIGSTFFLTKYFYENVPDNSETNTLYVPAGQRAQLTLQDGTSVWLNAQSSLTYPARFSGKTRRVTVSGEAYFDVAENLKKPFVVSTQHIEMKVLGTQFNVYSYPETGYIQTDLVEGSLNVYGKHTPQTSVTLKPKEQLIVKGGKMQVRPISNSEYFLWKEGIYTFYNEKLLDIIEKLQLYYDVKIIVKDPEIFNVRYTGKFRQRDGIDEILRIIQKIQKFTIEKDTENNIITLTK